MVDALVLNYNDSKSTIDCINNLRKCTYINRIVVVDNASSDNSCNELKSYMNGPK